MGWCGATRIFDKVVEALLINKQDPRSILKDLIEELEDADWDCQNESDYWDHPVVREVMREIHPDWDFD